MTTTVSEESCSNIKETDAARQTDLHCLLMLRAALSQCTMPPVACHLTWKRLCFSSITSLN